MNRDKIEFYVGPTAGICSVESSMVPTVGQFISIRGQTYTVKAVTFAVDYADDPIQKSMRCNVDLVKGDVQVRQP